MEAGKPQDLHGELAEGRPRKAEPGQLLSEPRGLRIRVANNSAPVWEQEMADGPTQVGEVPS